MSVEPTTDRIMPCGACGLEGVEGRDIRMTLVELPPDQQRPVSVPLPVNHHAHAPIEYREVVERYANEPRCRDRKACDDRVSAFLAPRQPESDPKEDATTWRL